MTKERKNQARLEHKRIVGGPATALARPGRLCQAGWALHRPKLTMHKHLVLGPNSSASTPSWFLQCRCYVQYFINSLFKATGNLFTTGNWYIYLICRTSYSSFMDNVSGKYKESFVCMTDTQTITHNWNNFFCWNKFFCC